MLKKSSIVLCTFTSSFNILTIVTCSYWRSLPYFYVLLLLTLTFLPLSHFHVKKFSRYFVFFWYRTHPFYQFTFCFEKSSIDLCTFISYFNILYYFYVCVLESFHIVVPSYILPFSHFRFEKYVILGVQLPRILTFFTFSHFRFEKHSIILLNFSCRTLPFSHACFQKSFISMCFVFVLFYISPYSFQLVLLIMFVCLYCNVFGFVLVAHINNTFL